MKTLTLKKLFAAWGVSAVTACALADDNTKSTMPESMPPPTPANTPATESATTPTSSSSMTRMTSQKFVTTAAIGGMKEVTLGNEALQRSQNTDVKNFAAMLVRDHTASNLQLEAIARQEGLQLPTTNTFTANDPVWESSAVRRDQTIKGQGAQLLTETNWPYLSEYLTIQRLKTLSGPTFDQAYLSDMVSDHAQDIAMFETASRDLTDLQLKQFATSTLPTLREHYRQAQQLAAKFAVAPANHKLLMQSAATP